ncbi:MAG: hypothetical protein WAN22_14115 [Solirubrobacteraceae bacterium]
MGICQAKAFRYRAEEFGRAVVVVVITEVSDDHVQVLLCTDDDGIATEADAVLVPWIAGRPHRLLIHGDVSDPHWDAKMKR